jgi:hypothetical protein
MDWTVREKNFGYGVIYTKKVKVTYILSFTWVKTLYMQVVEIKSGPYFNISNLFPKINNMLYYTTNLYLQ